MIIAQVFVENTCGCLNKKISVHKTVLKNAVLHNIPCMNEVLINSAIPPPKSSKCTTKVH